MTLLSLFLLWYLAFATHRAGFAVLALIVSIIYALQPDKSRHQ
jgi:hypothetical protein